MTTFNYQVNIGAGTEDVVSAALGASVNAKLNLNDQGKAVKLGTNNNYVLTASGDEIEGIVSSVEAFTVNDGFSFGSVRKNGRAEAVVGSGQTPALAVGAYVVSGAQAAANTAGELTVIGGNPTRHMWRVIRHITGTGAAGDRVLIERV